MSRGRDHYVTCRNKRCGTCSTDHCSAGWLCELPFLEIQVVRAVGEWVCKGEIVCERVLFAGQNDFEKPINQQDHPENTSTDELHRHRDRRKGRQGERKNRNKELSICHIQKATEITCPTYCSTGRFLTPWPEGEKHQNLMRLQSGAVWPL